MEAHSINFVSVHSALVMGPPSIKPTAHMLVTKLEQNPQITPTHKIHMGSTPSKNDCRKEKTEMSPPPEYSNDKSPPRYTPQFVERPPPSIYDSSYERHEPPFPLPAASSRCPICRSLAGYEEERSGGQHEMNEIFDGCETCEQHSGVSGRTI